jgi:hypothetical protein
MDSALPPKNYNAPRTQNLPRGEVLGVNMVNDTSWDFLKSPRFWVMVLGALSIYGQQKGFLGDAEMQFIATLSALFIGIRTLDRTVDKLTP